jgi:hypothetical protein
MRFAYSGRSGHNMNTKATMNSENKQPNPIHHRVPKVLRVTQSKDFLEKRKHN